MLSFNSLDYRFEKKGDNERYYCWKKEPSNNKYYGIAKNIG